MQLAKLAHWHKGKLAWMPIPFVRAQLNKETAGQALLSFPAPSPRTQRKLGRNSQVSNEHHPDIFCFSAYFC